MKALKPFVLMAVALGIAVASLPRAADEELDTVPAMKVAQDWLRLVDAGQYASSWDAAAEYFRASVTQSQWETAMRQVRGHTGNVVARKVKSALFTRALPDAPAGEYVVIQYDTGFERGFAVETVTPMHEKDGSWKVSGYYIK